MYIIHLDKQCISEDGCIPKKNTTPDALHVYIIYNIHFLHTKYYFSYIYVGCINIVILAISMLFDWLQYNSVIIIWVEWRENIHSQVMCLVLVCECLFTHMQ